MTRDEIIFFKHCLKDYNFFIKSIEQLKLELDYILEERHHITLKTTSIIRAEKDRKYESVYSSDEYYDLLKKEKRCQSLINIYSNLAEYTMRNLNRLDPHTKEVLNDIYINRLRPSYVADKYYYSDEKSMYRMIRTNLKKYYE